MITILDLRTMQVSQTLENPTHFGPITCMCMDRKRTWIVVGTSGGVLSLWDRRFGLLLRNWKCAAAASGKSTRIHQCVLHPSKGRGRWIMVAVETIKPSTDASLITLVEVWDVEKCTIVESYATRSTPVTSNEVEESRETSGLDAENDPAAAMATLVRSRRSVDRHRSSENLAQDEVPRPAPDVRAMVTGLEFGGHSTHRLDISDLNPDSSHSSSRPGGRGFLITGSEDRKIRLWDLDKLERTTVLTESEPEYEKPSYRHAILTLFITAASDFVHSSTVQAGKNVASIYLETSPQQPGGNSQLRRAPQRIYQMANNQRDLLRHHHDVVTALACIDSPFRGGIVSGDRSGVLKVLRVELSD
jgi:phosphoinositide-3-kinase regulatory subunit 4